MSNKIIKLINKSYFFLVFVLMATMINYRSLIVDKAMGNFTDCNGCYKQWVVKSDAKIYSILLVIWFLSYAIKRYSFRVILRVFVLGFISYALVDIYLYKYLNQRLYLGDIATYFHFDTIMEILTRNLGQYVYLVIIFIISTIFSLIFLHKQERVTFFDKSLFFVGILYLLSAIVFTKNIEYVHDAAMRNVVDINISSTESVDYSEETIKKLDNYIEKYQHLNCESNGLNKPKNIILVLWESLSMYQSQLFSGINNWTPHLDDIAKNNRYYTNFFANNFNSLDGRLAVLTGEKTFCNIASLDFHVERVGYWNNQRNIPKMLKKYGYSSSFLDGANLDFCKVDTYMEAIGFNYVEGQEYIGYKNKPRFGFNSVSDDVLYNRVLDYIKQQKTPYFSTVITVTTHPPFLDPITRKPSLEKATKYADKSLFDFYNSLQKQQFFDNGILIIMSDHRSMTPVSAEELKKFGKQAVSKIPLVVIDKDYTGSAKTEEYLQQSDLLNSIQYLVDENHCSRNGEGNLFSNPAKPSQCVFHNRGDFRDQIDVYCDEGKQTATVKLDGDNTRIISGHLDNSKSIIELINITRIAARKRHKSYLGNSEK